MRQIVKFIGLHIRVYVIHTCLMIVLNLQNVRTWTAAEKMNPVCNTTACQKLSETYLKNINEHGNPCTDFYDYVCHGWEVQNPKPKYEQFWTVETEMQERVKKTIIKLLESPKSNDTQVLQATALYNAFMDLPFMPKTTAKNVQDEMMKVGNRLMLFNQTQQQQITSHPWGVVDNHYLRLTGESALLNLYPTSGLINNNRIVTKVSQPYSPYGMLKRFYDWGIFSDDKNNYTEFLLKVVRSVSPYDITQFSESIELDLYNVLKFREYVRNISDEAPNETLDLMTIQELQTWYDVQSNLVDTANINWLETIRALYKNSVDSYGYPIQNSTILAVQKDYLSRIVKLLQTTPMDVIVNHIQLYFAERHVLLTAEMEENLEHSCGTYTEPEGAIRYSKPRSIWSVEHVALDWNMLETLDKMYVGDAFSATTKLEVEQLFEDAKNAMKEQIQHSTWLDPEIKISSIEKIDLMSCAIGYPQGLLLPTGNIDPDVNDLRPLIVNAHYVAEKNRVYISAALLQSPIFTATAPYVIHYGATVSMIGHEMYHGFDHNGLLFDKYGDKPGWSKATFYEYDAKSTCFKDRYEKYREDELKKRDLEPEDEPPSTLDADIADAMGLKLAYEGFKRKLKQSGNVCPVLPGFENLGCEKLFFIAFANRFCSKSSGPAEGQQLLYDNHSLNRIKVNGAVANMNEFSSAFNCKAGEPMNPHQKCNIWKD